MSSTADARFMARALELGRLGLGRTAPNPSVGCVLTRGDRIIGEGFHRAAGTPHAEIVALRSVANGDARDATAYVTLEPCNHRGRTPPCSEALIDAGVGRVVVSVRDPNPHVAGGGLDRLAAAGIKTTDGVLAREGAQLLRPFSTWIETGRPLVTIKVASTLDGRIATGSGHSQWITGAESRRVVHEMRDCHDAIAVGAGTVRADNPALTTRLPGGGGHDPIRVVWSSAGQLPNAAQILSGPPETLILVGRESAHTDALRARGLTVIRVGAASDPRGATEAPDRPRAQGATSGRDAAGDANLVDGLRALGERGITSLLVEGGQGLVTGLLRARLVDRLAIFVAPKIVGGDGLGWAGPLGTRTMSQCLQMGELTTRRLGDDILFEGDCVYGDR